MYAFLSSDPRDVASVVLQFVNHVNAGDLEKMAPMLAPDHLLSDDPAQSFEGRVSALRHWRDLFSLCPDYRMDILDMERLGDSVYIVGYSRGTLPSGERSKAATTWYVRVSDTRIAEWRVYAERAIKQLQAVAVSS